MNFAHNRLCAGKGWAEFDRAVPPSFKPLPDVDGYAPKAGFDAGFAVASDGKREWMVHCYGAVGVGRDLKPDTGDGSELYAVIGQAPRRDDISYWWARGADDVVSAARQVGRLEDALAGCELTVATTASRARRVYDPITPAEVAQLASTTLGDEQTLAVVFGRERSGLSGAEVAMCQRVASIATDGESPTMNLAQAVAIFCYELHRDRRLAMSRPALAPPAELTHQLRGHANRLFHEVGFVETKNELRICAEMEALAGRAVLSMRETSLLLSLVRRIEARLGVDERIDGEDNESD